MSGVAVPLSGPSLSPPEILARLQQVDGAGSGLDADTVDRWSPSVAPIAPFGAPMGIPLSPTPVPTRNSYPNSLFRN